jgi:hypothetical protein
VKELISSAFTKPAPLVEIVLRERERFMDAQPGAPQDDDHRSHAPAVRVIRGVAMSATISSTVGGSAGYRIPLLRGGGPA